MPPSILNCKIKANHLTCQGLSFLIYKLGIMADTPPITVPVMINEINF